MSNRSRRELLRDAGLAALTIGLTTVDAQHVHQVAAEQTKAAGGVYKPKALNASEFATLRRLCDLTFPGSLEGGAPEFIDLLCSNNADLRAIYTGGIGWLDHHMSAKYGALFVAAKPDQQIEMMELIAYRKNTTPDLAPGIHFFDWMRRMTSDAYYTSAAGIKDLGFMGNKGMAKFEVPVEAIEYAVKRSGLV